VPDADLERTLIENFQNEAIALDRVRHPNIISRLGHGTAIDLAGVTFHYLVLEYLPGGDLATLCRRQPLTLDRTLYYLEQVCAGLAHAHECGVIHRDIKPHNLLLTADSQTVKIADFGVAKIEPTEGAITRVGTNVYAPPEHSPLVQTGPLDAATLTDTQRLLTPAADIYSLAKTTYALLTGESPRRFSHRQITELPQPIAGQAWAPSLLRVLERATQTRASDRYQTVEEFWTELLDASLPPTQPLPSADQTESRPRPTGRLARGTENHSSAPPRPQFNATRLSEGSPVYGNGPLRPHIVIPVSGSNALELEKPAPRQPAREIIAGMPDVPPTVEEGRRRRRRHAGRGLRVLVATMLILAFAGMLLATHTYFRSRWNTPSAAAPTSKAQSDVGREIVTTTDVNLRSAPGASNPRVGLAEQGSRVKVLSVDHNWYEVQIVQHGRKKDDPSSSDRGWVNKKFLVLD